MGGNYGNERREGTGAPQGVEGEDFNRGEV